MHAVHRPGFAALFGMIGVVVAVLLVAIPLVPGGSLHVPGISAGTLAFEGVNLSIAYSGGSPGILGPTHQNSCLQQSPYTDSPDCPANLTGGSSYTFSIFEVYAPVNVSSLWVNMTIVSPLPIDAAICRFGPPPLYAPTNSVNATVWVPGGEGCAWYVMIALPDPAPTIPGGLWLQGNMTVHVL